eukprot:scaffold289471_cov57-Attheya_sp.AAC.1
MRSRLPVVPAGVGHRRLKVCDAGLARQFSQQQQLRGHDLFTQRSFVTSGMLSLSLSRSDFTAFTTEEAVKQLERVVNQNQSNPTVQYEFMSELSKRYPEGVVEFFESSNGSMDERCAMVHPLKIEALRELAAKGSKAGSHTGQATVAMSILAGGSGAAMGGEGVAAAATGGGMWDTMG